MVSSMGALIARAAAWLRAGSHAREISAILRAMRALLLGVVLVMACKGKGGTPAAGSASGGSGSAPVADAAVAAVAAADAAPPAAKLELEDPPDATLGLAFGKAPVLPAVSADGTLVADYQSHGAPGLMVQPLNVGIRPLGGGKVEELAILDFEEAEKLEEDWAKKPPPALAKKLKERGEAIVKRLAGFASLAPIALPRDDNDLELKLPG